jgi:predicted MFS family arabinose efflux permease
VESRRPLGFSLWIASGIATGIAGGLLGSRLPAWIAAAGVVGDAAAKRWAIVAGCGLMAAALWPLSRLRLPRAAAPKPRIYPRNRFVARYLLIWAIWQLAIGAFNPFFNVYFSRKLSMSLEQIGTVFAGSQFLQAAGVLLVPLAIKRLGLLSSLAGFQAASATCLALIAAAASPWAAALLYAAYMSFQVMTEPGLFTMLLNRVSASEQEGASALLFLVMFSCHAIAAPLAGQVATLLGYERLLAGAASLAFLTALLSRTTLGVNAGAAQTARAGAAAD